MSKLTLLARHDARVDGGVVRDGIRANAVLVLHLVEQTEGVLPLPSRAASVDSERVGNHAWLESARAGHLQHLEPTKLW